MSDVRIAALRVFLRKAAISSLPLLSAKTQFAYGKLLAMSFEINDARLKLTFLKEKPPGVLASLCSRPSA